MKNSMEVGHELADILVDWHGSVAKPTPEDLARAIMHALERFSTTAEGTKESYLGGILYSLDHKIEERQRAI